MSDETENLNTTPQEAAGSQPAETPADTNATAPTGKETNSDNTGKSLRDAIGKIPEESKPNSNILDFNVATEEEVKNYIDGLPKIDNVDLYKDLKIGDDFGDLPEKLMEAKIPPQQFKPLLDYWNNKLEDLYTEQTSEEDYQEKLHKFMGNEYEQYHNLTDQQLIKYVPNELRESVKTASNDLMVATKMVIAGTIKEYETLINKIKDDYGVDPTKYKIGKLNGGKRDINNERAALTKEIFELKMKGDNAGVEQKAAQLRKLMGFNTNAEN